MMSSEMDNKGSAIKVLHVLDALAGYAVTGVSNTALAAQTNMKPCEVTRTINVLIQKGWARKDAGTGHFHPTSYMGRVFGKVLADFDRARQRLDDLQHNFTHH